jgi:photosystem II stability/assembly factor-like uncharacterized protein
MDRDRADSEEALKAWFRDHLPDVPDDVRFDHHRSVHPVSGPTSGRRTSWLFGAVAVAAAFGLLLAPHFLGRAGVGPRPTSPTGKVSRPTGRTKTPPGDRRAAAPLPIGLTFSAVDFTTPSQGFLAGARAIFATQDGGTAWTRVYRGAADVLGLQMVTGQVGFAWGALQSGATAILATTNGGVTWREVGSLDTAASGFTWPTPRVGYAVTSHHGIMKTADGGRTWSALSQPAVSVSFVSAAKGYALYGPDVYATDNGGASWTAIALVPPGTQVGGGEVRATADGSVWAYLVGGAGMSQASYTVFRSTDGVHWAPVMSLSTAGGGPAPASARAAGPGASPGPIDPLSQADAFVTGTCSACLSGTSQVVGTTTGGRTWIPTPVQSGPLPGLIQSPEGISFASPSTGYVVVSAFPPNSSHAVTMVYKTTDGAQSWTAIYNGGVGSGG